MAKIAYINKLRSENQIDKLIAFREENAEYTRKQEMGWGSKALEGVSNFTKWWDKLGTKETKTKREATLEASKRIGKSLINTACHSRSVFGCYARQCGNSNRQKNVNWIICRELRRSNAVFTTKK